MMKNVIKSVLYWASLVCPIVDIFKGVVRGISSSLETAQEDIELLKTIRKEDLINHKSVLNQAKFDKDN